MRAAKKGYVGERHVDGGALMSVNSPVCTIVGIDTVYIEMAVTERDYPLIASGQKALITVDALPGKTFTGKISGSAPLSN